MKEMVSDLGRPDRGKEILEKGKSYLIPRDNNDTVMEGLPLLSLVFCVEPRKLPTCHLTDEKERTATSDCQVEPKGKFKKWRCVFEVFFFFLFRAQ